MKYDKTTLKKFILNYHSVQKYDDVNEYNEGLEDFFEINNQVETDSGNSNSIEDVIFYNELENIVERVGTDKEYFIFILLTEGNSYKGIGNVFNVTVGRIRQMFDELLSKLS